MDIIFTFTTITYIYFSFNFILLISLLFSCLTIASTDMFISIFLLVGTYFFSVLLFGLMRCEFLAFVILLVYLGAIAVLFLFIVMSAPSKSIGVRSGSLVTAFIFPLLLFLPLIVFIVDFLPLYSYNLLYIDNLLFNNIEQIGVLLYTSHMLVFVLCGFILFIAVICVIRISRIFRH